MFARTSQTASVAGFCCILASDAETCTSDTVTNLHSIGLTFGAMMLSSTGTLGVLEYFLSLFRRQNRRVDRFEQQYPISQVDLLPWPLQ